MELILTERSGWITARRTARRVPTPPWLGLQTAAMGLHLYRRRPPESQAISFDHFPDFIWLWRNRGNGFSGLVGCSSRLRLDDRIPAAAAKI